MYSLARLTQNPDRALKLNTDYPGHPQQPTDSHCAERVRASFDRQPFMRTLGARLLRVAAGEAEIELPFRSDLCQQDGYLHAGVVTTLVDNACGYAAYTLMPATTGVLTVEFKLNMLSPAIGESIRARGRVIKAGRQVTVCAGDVFAAAGDKQKLVATMLATMMAVHKDSAPVA